MRMIRWYKILLLFTLKKKNPKNAETFTGLNKIIFIQNYLQYPFTDIKIQE